MLQMELRSPGYRPEDLTGALGVGRISLTCSTGHVGCVKQRDPNNAPNDGTVLEILVILTRSGWVANLQATEQKDDGKISSTFPFGASISLELAIQGWL